MFCLTEGFVIKKSTNLILAAVCTFGIVSGVYPGASNDHWKGLADLEFPGGYLTTASAERMLDELDFQRTCRDLNCCDCVWQNGLVDHE